MMKKIILLLIFGLFMGLTYGQSITKTRYSKTIIGNHLAAGATDSVIVTLNPAWGYVFQIRPVFGLNSGGTAADSIYASIKTYVSNSDNYAAWTEIRCNDNVLYTGLKGDTLITANATLNGAWMWTPETALFKYVRVKLVLTLLAKTDEDNRYDIYYVAKPASGWTHMY